MRRHMIVAGCVSIAALLALGVLSGCGRQAEEPGTEMPMIADEPEAPADDDAAGAEAAGDVAETLADAVKNWPSSFIMKATIEYKDSGRTESPTVAYKMGDMKPLKMKVEMPEGGMILDHEERAMYTWDASSGRAMKMELTDEESAGEEPYGQVDPDARITGSETIDGVDCWVVETTSDGGVTTKTWFAKENGLVRRTESSEVLANYQYEQVGSMPDSEFELPEGMTVQEMPAMPEMPEMPDMPRAPR